MVGKTFGRLTVLKQSPRKSGKIYWSCLCSCGKVVDVEGYHLRSGRTKSCGCYKADRTRERSKTHGLYNTRLHVIWSSMKIRCYNRNHQAYKNYGGRGISVCAQWKSNFKCFYDWAMDNGYNDSLTIDRIDTNGNYSPENCRWIDMKSQAQNRRNNVYLTDNGQTKTVSDWAAETGQHPWTLFYRIRLKWNDHEVIYGKKKSSR